MTNEVYWDKLGIAWSANRIATDTNLQRLQSCLWRQSLLIAGGLAAGLSLAAASALLGVFTLWSGWTVGAWNFVTRGIALIVIAGILFVGALRFLPVMRGDQAKTLPEMLDLNIARAERMLVVDYLGIAACAIVTAFGLVGTAIRNATPAMSPVLDVAILAIVALCLFMHGRQVRARIEKFRFLKRTLAAEA